MGDAVDFPAKRTAEAVRNTLIAGKKIAPVAEYIGFVPTNLRKPGTPAA